MAVAWEQTATNKFDADGEWNLKQAMFPDDGATMQASSETQISTHSDCVKQ